MIHKSTWFRLFSILLVICTAIAPFNAVMAAAGNDTASHWAEGILKDAVSKGWIQGYEDGTLRPDRYVTRAETAELVNRIFGHDTQASEVSFTDLSPGGWEYAPVAKAVYAGYMNGYEDGTFRPGNPISRQEVSVIAARLVSVKNSREAADFADQDQIAEWSADSAGIVAAKRIMNGYEDGSFKPANPITRAEAVAVFSRAAAQRVTLFDRAGTFGPAEGIQSLDGDVRVSVSGVTLRNMVITGNLLLDKNIGEGDIYLKNVTVNGSAYVQGGGKNSVHLEDSVLVSIVVEKKNGEVRIVATGSTTVQEMDIFSAVKVEENGTSGQGFTSIKLSDKLPEGTKVTLVGDFDQVNVDAAKISLDIPSGTVAKLNVNEHATQSAINLGKETTVLEMSVNTAIQVTGEGKVENAIVTDEAKDTRFETKPEAINGTPGTGTATVPAPPAGAPGTPYPTDNSTPPSVPDPLPKTQTPTVTGTVYADMTEIIGQAEAGSNISIKRGETVLGSANAPDGTYTIQLTSPLSAGDTLSITAVNTGKITSDPLDVTVSDYRQPNVIITGVQKITTFYHYPIIPGSVTVTVYKTAEGSPYKLPITTRLEHSLEAKTMTIHLNNIITAGTYEVHIRNGLRTDIFTLLAQAERQILEFKLDSAVPTSYDPKIATTKYRVVNQYGEDITRVAIPYFNSNAGVVTALPTGELRIQSNQANFYNGQMIVLSAAVGGNVQTKVLTVGPVEVPAAPPVPSHPSDPLPQPGKRIEIYGLYHPEGKDLSVDSAMSEYKVLFAAKKENGDFMTPEELNRDILFISSNGMELFDTQAGIPVFGTTSLDGKNWATLSLKRPPYGVTAATITLTFVMKSTGETASLRITVKDRSKLDTLTIQFPSRVAAGQKITIPYTAKNQFGETITDRTAIAAGISAFATHGLAQFGLNEQGSLELDLTGVSVSQPQHLFLTIVNLHNGKIVSGVTVLQPDANSSDPVNIGTEPVTTSFVMNPPPLVVAGEKVEIPFTARDQYGNEMTSYSAINDGLLILGASGTPNGLHLEYDPITNRARLMLDVTAVSVITNPHPITLLVLTKGGQVSDLELNLLPAAKPTLVFSVSMTTPVLAVGAKQIIKASDIQVVDQYLRPSTLQKWISSGYTAKLESMRNNATLSSQLLGTAPIELTGMRAGYTTISASLKDYNNYTVSGSGYSFQVTIVDHTQIDSYSFTVSGAVYANPGLPEYIRPFQVYGLTADGSKVAIPDSYISTVTDNTYLNAPFQNGALRISAFDQEIWRREILLLLTR